MSTGAAKRAFFWRVVRPLSGAVVLLLASFLVVLATTTTEIDLNDGTIDDWQTAGIPIFLEDPEGDAAAPEYDLINGSVATSVNSSGNFTFLNFMVQTAGGVLSIPSGQHVVVASLDCDNDGIDRESNDYLIVFLPTSDPANIEGTTIRTDGVGNIGVTLDPDTGQRIGDRTEWGIDNTVLGFPNDCAHEIGIRFMTAHVAPTGSGGFTYTILDQTDLRRYNVPTVVELQEFSAAPGLMSGPLPIGLAVAVFAGILLFANRLRTRRD